MNQNNSIDIEVLPVYIPALTDDAPILVLYGGRGSGKSVFAAQKVILRILQYENQKALVVRKYAVNLRNSVYAELLKVIQSCGLTQFFDATTNPLEITCKTNGNKIIFVGLDDGEKVKSISGVTIAWVEECTQLTEADFSQVDLSVRGKLIPPVQIIISFNPIDKKHWIFKSMFTKKVYNCSIYKTTFRDNKFVDIEAYEMKLKQYEANTNYYGVVANGEWGEQTDTQIFTNWKVDTTMSGDYTDYKTIYGGCDFGDRDPNTALLVSVVEDTIYVVKEYYKNGPSGQAMIKDMLELFPMDVYYSCDSSRPGQITDMNNAGIKAFSVKKNLVEDGIHWIIGRKIKVHPSCSHTISELELYQWRQDKDGVILKDKPLDADNHCIDALRYALRELMTEPLNGTATWSFRI